MKIKSSVLGIAIVVIMFAGIGLSSSLGLWQTTSSKVPATFKRGDFKGEYNPADIRGSYSFNDVSTIFDIPLSDLASAFGVFDVENVGDFKNKDLEVLYSDLKEQGLEIGNDSVRVFVAIYKGLPYEFNPDTYLLKQAADILKNSAELSDEQIKYLENNSIDISSAKVQQPIGTPESTEHIEETETMIKGKTTFREVLDWGVSREDIEQVIGTQLPNPLVNIKDFCGENRLEFSTVKSELQQKIDNIQQ